MASQETQGEQQRSMERPRSSEVMPGGRESQLGGPFSMLRHFNDLMDRMFDDFFGARSSPARGFERMAENTWWPQIEVSHRDDKLVITADVPGLKREDVKVEVRDNELCISGERKSESEKREGGYYRSERNYGSFYRSVPLPEGAKAETASATFENGVLKVEIDAPTQKAAPRRIEVREGRPH